MIFKVNSGFIGIIILFIVLISSCKEVPPHIDLTIPDETLIDTTYEYFDTIIPPQEKKVLIEDLTGQSCVFCPPLQDSIHSIILLNPQRVFTYSIHHENYDYTGLFIDVAMDLLNNLGYDFPPTSAIDRKRFDPDYVYSTDMSTLNTRVIDRLNILSPLNIEFIQNEYDNQSREFNFIVKVVFHEDVLGERFLSLALTEDSVQTIQQTPVGRDSFYMQPYVLRDLLTPYVGIPLNSLSSGRVFEKEFKYIIDENWNEDKCYLVAFVHQAINHPDSNEIDQVNQIPIIDN